MLEYKFSFKQNGAWYEFYHIFNILSTNFTHVAT